MSDPILSLTVATQVIKTPAEQGPPGREIPVFQYLGQSTSGAMSQAASTAEFEGLRVENQEGLALKVDKVAGKSLVDDDEILRLSLLEIDADGIKTNIGHTATATDIKLLSSTGTGSTIEAATPEQAGVMSASDKAALDLFPSKISALEQLPERIEALEMLPTRIEALELLPDQVDGKVIKVDGYSLVPDSEITRLSEIESNATKNRSDADTDLVISGMAASIPGIKGDKGDKGTDGVIGVDGAKGEDGKNVELRATATHLEWRVEGAAVWTQLLAIQDIADLAAASLGNRLIPAGGAEGFALAKKSEADFDVSWVEVAPVPKHIPQSEFLLFTPNPDDSFTVSAKPEAVPGTAYEVEGVTYYVLVDSYEMGDIIYELDESTFTGEEPITFEAATGGTVSCLIGNLVTTNVDDMYRLFRYLEVFNAPLSFDTSSVTDMSGMFEDAYAFNQPLNFDTSSVEDMSSMFESASAFNQPLNFDTGLVTDMDYMFQGAAAFDQDLMHWNVSLIFSEPSSFAYGATAWDREGRMPKWGTTGGPDPEPAVLQEVGTASDFLTVTTIAPGVYTVAAGPSSAPGDAYTVNGAVHYIVRDDKEFGELLGSGKGNEYVARIYLSEDRGLVQCPVGNLVTTNVTDMSYAFQQWTDFNAPLTYDMSNVTATRNMFQSATSFDQPLFMNMPKADDVYGMFINATSLNSPVVLSIGSAQILNALFSGCTSFNQPIMIDAPMCIKVVSLFEGATSLNQDVRIQASASIELERVFNGATAFNSNLEIAEGTEVTSLVGLFTNATSYNQPITFDTSKVTNFSEMFKGATAFNQPLLMDTSSGTYFWSMFESANLFNQAVNFDMSKAVNLSSMFKWARSFNQPVDFSTSSPTDVGSMFLGAVSFNSPVSINTVRTNTLTSMFSGATIFNQPLDFNLPAANEMGSMFRTASAFNQDLSSWRVPLISTAPSYFSDGANSWVKVGRLPQWGVA